MVCLNRPTPEAWLAWWMEEPLTAERERDGGWTNGQAARSSNFGCGLTDRTDKSLHRTGSSRMEVEQDSGTGMVENDGAGELRLLDKQLLRQYNPDPHVADYESTEEVMEIWLNA